MELKPCPFCGDSEHLLIEHAEGTILHPAYRVLCDSCGASCRYTDQDHVAVWNERRPTPEPQAEYPDIKPNGFDALEIAKCDDIEQLRSWAHCMRRERDNWRARALDCDTRPQPGEAQGDMHQIGWVNVASKKFYTLAEWAATPRNQALVDEGRVHRVYAETCLQSAWDQCRPKEPKPGEGGEDA